ncbi:DUF3108 domain-containing protein [Fulvivirgaceae bacterium BMA10]|uniref:DUF3108 domain-containing protein n=1 Tax=Splendidivirga corallicola TaxID=3051826 RepID=A0ABT8KM29_9BACT|nr:DUF3108 domain-containing protein [Fulvivirgaceae bacterium BMA10]
MNANKFRCLILILAHIVASYNLTIAQCWEKNFAFAPGEKVSYNVYYNWGIIWLDAGIAEFKVDEIKHQNRDAYKLQSLGVSHKKYDWIYRVRDKYESIVDKESLRPMWYLRQTEEGKYRVRNEFNFDNTNNKIYIQTENSNRSNSLDTLDLQDCTFDLLSTIYYSRNIDYNQYKKNDKIPLTIIIDNEIHNLHIRYLGKEVLKTKDKKKYNCIKFKPMLVEGTMFRGGEHMTVWVSDDANKIPILIEAKVLVGSVKAYLAHYEGLNGGLTSRIK